MAKIWDGSTDLDSHHCANDYYVGGRERGRPGGTNVTAALRRFAARPAKALATIGIADLLSLFR